MGAVPASATVACTGGNPLRPLPSSKPVILKSLLVVPPLMSVPWTGITPVPVPTPKEETTVSQLAR